MTGKMSRSKGLRGEREVFKLFEAAGGTVLNLDGQGDHLVELGDVLFHVESKRSETVRMSTWVAQAAREAARPYYVPVVVWRQNHRDWQIDLPFDAFLELMTK